MPAEWWLDAFNVFHRWAATRDDFAARGDIGATLARAMARLARALGPRAARTTAFLDGGPARESGVAAHGLRYRMPGPGRRADDLLAEALAGRGARARTIAVVTDDRALASTLASLGGKVTGVDAFLATLAKTPPRGARVRRAAAGRDEVPRDRPLSPVEVAAWLRYFGGEATDETV